MTRLTGCEQEHLSQQTTTDSISRAQLNVACPVISLAVSLHVYSNGTSDKKWRLTIYRGYMLFLLLNQRENTEGLTASVHEAFKSFGTNALMSTLRHTKQSKD